MTSTRWLVTGLTLIVAAVCVDHRHAAVGSASDRIPPRERAALTKAVLASNRGQEYALVLDGAALETLNEMIDREGSTWPTWGRWGPAGRDLLNLDELLRAVGADVSIRRRVEDETYELPVLPDPRDSASISDFRSAAVRASASLPKAEEAAAAAKKKAMARGEAEAGCATIFAAIRRWMKGMRIVPKYSDLLATDDPEGAMLTKKALLDPWGTEYRFAVTPSGSSMMWIVVESAGEDRTFGTADDVKKQGY